MLLEGPTVHRTDQRTPYAAEKVQVPDTAGVSLAAGGAIRGTRAGACAGMSVHGPFV